MGGQVRNIEAEEEREKGEEGEREQEKYRSGGGREGQREGGSQRREGGSKESVGLCSCISNQLAQHVREYKHVGG